MTSKNQKTELMNYAIAKALLEVEREQAKQEILSQLANPLNTKKTNIYSQHALQEIRSKELNNLKRDKLESGY